MNKLWLRFWSKVHISTPDQCWLWTAASFRKGYGAFYFQGHSQRAHRVAWILCRGPIPDDTCVCHHCDRPACVNPNHLFLGTIADNTVDMYAKGRGLVRLGPCNGRGSPKLSPQDVHEIRSLLAAGSSQAALAREFDVKPGTIWAIVHGKSWAWLSSPTSPSPRTILPSPANAAGGTYPLSLSPTALPD